VGLDFLAALTMGQNNVVASARQHAILVWAAWRFTLNLQEEGKQEATKTEFDRFVQAVESIQLAGQVRVQQGAAPNVFGDGSKKRLLEHVDSIPLRFAEYGRKPDTSAFAAANYGPFMKQAWLDLGRSVRTRGLGFIAGTGGVFTPTEGRGTALAEALDGLLRESRHYPVLCSSEPPESLPLDVVVELAAAGLVVDSEFPARPEVEPYITALFDLDEPDLQVPFDGRRRTLCYLIHLLAGEGHTLEEVRRMQLAERGLDQEQECTSSLLRNTERRWALFQLRQLQRSMFEAWRLIAELWMGSRVGTVGEMVAKVEAVLGDVGASGNPIHSTIDDSILEYQRSFVREGIAAWAGAEDGPLGLVRGLQHNLHPRRAESAEAGVVPALRLTLAVLLLLRARIVEGGHGLEDFFEGGKRLRVSLGFFARWAAERSHLTLGQFLGEMLHEFVLQQHMAIAVARMDGEGQRLRFHQQEAGWELLDKVKPDELPVTADRLKAMVELLRDCRLADRDGDNYRSTAKGREVAQRALDLCI